MNELNKTLSPAEARQYSPLTLAFLGDSVYEQLVRTEGGRVESDFTAAAIAEEIARRLRPDTSRRKVKKQQKAATPEAPKGHFSEEEEYIFKRGRNSSHIGAPKSATNTDYRAATGLEAVFGYLELIGGAERIRELYRVIRENIAAEQDQ